MVSDLRSYSVWRDKASSSFSFLYSSEPFLESAPSSKLMLMSNSFYSLIVSNSFALLNLMFAFLILWLFYFLNTFIENLTEVPDLCYDWMEIVPPSYSQIFLQIIRPSPLVS